jgi:hypothetical protein
LSGAGAECGDGAAKRIPHLLLLQLNLNRSDDSRCVLKPDHFSVDIDEWSVLADAEMPQILGRFAQQLRYAVNPVTDPTERNKIELVVSMVGQTRKEPA